MARVLSLVAVACGLAAAVGCGGGGKVPLRGKVAYTDGTPITEGKLTFVSADPHAPSPLAEIESDGTYAAYTDKPGDGVPPGTYAVGLQPLGYDFTAKNPRPFDQKYADPAKSGFKVTVDANTPTFDVTVPRLGQK